MGLSWLYTLFSFSLTKCPHAKYRRDAKCLANIPEQTSILWSFY